MTTIPLDDSVINEIKSLEIINSQEKPKVNSQRISPVNSQRISPVNSQRISPVNSQENSQSTELIEDDTNKELKCNIILILTEKDNKNPYLKAIFNYGIYKNRLDIIFERLIAIYNTNKNTFYYNEKDYIEEILKRVNKFINNIKYSDFNLQEINSSIYHNKNNQKCLYELNSYTNIDTNVLYDCYILLLINIYKFYIQTLGKSKFLNIINNYLKTNNENYITKAGWDLNIIKEIMNKDVIIKIKNPVFTDENFTIFINNYFYEETLQKKPLNIEIIKKIFSKKITNINPLYIKYSEINNKYVDIFSYNFYFNFYTKSKDNDKYIRIMKDSENNYINIFEGFPSNFVYA
jgi:hypothetical protein